VPDFSSCSNFTWSITNQTATEASGRFSAECGTGLVFSGTITGRLGGATIPIVVTGALTRGSDTCQFSLNGEGTQIDGVTFHITYSGTTCLGPLQGANTLSLAPHSTPTAFTISGTITDGTSGGVLPQIEVSAAGQAVRSDAAGHYQLSGVATGAVTVQFAAASYITQTKPINLTQNSTLDAVPAARGRRTGACAGSKRRRPDRHALRDRPRRLLRRRRQLAGDDADSRDRRELRRLVRRLLGEEQLA
jgi:hypothetical protein